MLNHQFSKFPLGIVKPSGWLEEQLKIQAAGLTGVLEEVWSDVDSNSAWLGGVGEGWERGPYYLDGLIPLAYLLEDDQLIQKSQKWIEWILNSQEPNGWFGPPKNKDWWCRMIVMKVMIQYFEVTEDERVLPFMTKYFDYMKQTLPDNPLNEWGQARGSDLILAILWLYEKTDNEDLMELVEIVSEQMTDWTKLYKEFPFKRYVTEFSHEAHVVNVAMSLKIFAIRYLTTGDEQLKEEFYEALKTLDIYHGQAHGMFSGDEWLAGTHPSQGTELCSIVEYMFSMEQSLQIFGDAKIGDLLEKVTFNALPATISRDWLSHQYDQQVNQVCCNFAKRNWTENSYGANTFGLAPHFGCCTANMHQGWPKFTASVWMREEDTFVCQSLVPSSLEVDGVKVSVEGNYPFEHKVTIKVEADRDYQLKIRIPAWATECTIKENDAVKLFKEQDGYIFLSGNIPNEYEVELTTAVQLVPRSASAVNVKYGPLLFALPIGEEWKIVGGNEPAYDWEVYPESQWNVGVSRFEDFVVKHNEYSSGQIFDSENSPLEIYTSGQEVKNWVTQQNSADTPPYKCVLGEKRDVRLVPYGGAKLRIAEFPTIDDRKY